MLSIDSIFEVAIKPLVKYPILIVTFVAAFTSYDVRKAYLPMLLLTLFLNIMIKLNTRLKLRGEWVELSKIDNAVCVVTGGSNGLGRAIVQEFLLKLPNVTLISLDIEPPKKSFPNVYHYTCDLSNSSDVDKTLKIVKRNHGDVTVLINNAGIRAKYQNFRELSKEVADKVFQVNVFTPMRLVQELSPEAGDLRQFYAVTVASALGVCAPARGSCYGASKAAAIAFHEAWAQELDETSRIRTLLVTPGQLDTTMFGGFHPPRQFFAPLVNPSMLAEKIVENCRIGMRGELSAPLYAHFMGIIRVLPYSLSYFARKVSGMDTCLPFE